MSMRYKLLGRSGLRVSELCLGTMTFGEDWGWGADHAISRQMFDAYAEAGGNFIDTANRYTNGTSEKYVGEFIKADREHFVVATKYTLYIQEGDPNKAGNHRKNMVQAVEASLKRLDTDFIDLYYVHAWDFTTPVDEVMRALDDLVRAGKVLYVGISDTPAWVVSQANTVAELRGWSRFAGLQIEYSLIERTVEQELIPMARAHDMAVLAWSVLGAGVLTGKYHRDNGSQPRRMQDRTLTAREIVIADEAYTIAQEIGRSPAQVVTNWVRQQPGVIIPILGARRLDQLQDNLGCLEFSLSAEHLARLNAVSEPTFGFPQRFLQRDNVRNMMFGGTLDWIDGHRRDYWPYA